MKKIILPVFASFLSLYAQSAATELVIKTDKPGAEIQPTMYGLFFEDINYAADGGLYAEMIKNRSFEFPNPLMGWESFGNVEVKTDGPFERCPHYVSLFPANHREKRTGLTNEGFFGVAFRQGEGYRFSVWARGIGGKSAITVELIDPASMGETQVMAKAKIDISSNDWKKYTVTLKPAETVAKGKLRVFLSSSRGCDLEHISLFPVDTWQHDDNGLRRDLAQKLADVHPGVLRFPGGCIVEGTDLPTRYQWKNSVGPVENRPLNENRWHYTFPHRFFPDYYQSYGLGFYEYFRLAEQIGAEPLPVLSVGLACQFQNKDEKAHLPVDSLQSYIRDALDLIEFANGDTKTTWGALRAEMGHPKPFNLKFLAIGNEQWGPEYPARLKPFVEAITKAHPEINLVGSSGPSPSGDKFDYLWPQMKKLKADLVDEHFYAPEEFFLSQATRYDKYDRKGPKVFAGEYACHGKGKKYNHFNAALMEAAFMTGLERNADVVYMATYAPLFAHVEGWQWRPDMIWFDNLNSVATASYYVQQLYATNKGTRVLPLTLDGNPVVGAEDQNGLYATAAVDEDRNCYIIKVVNTSAEPQEITLKFDGINKKKRLDNECRVVSLSSPNGPNIDNVDGLTERICPVHYEVTTSGNTVNTIIPASTFAVYTRGFK